MVLVVGQWIPVLLAIAIILIAASVIIIAFALGFSGDDIKKRIRRN
jgi:hypothetical protein